MSRLTEIRKDLSEIIAIKKMMDYQNCYDRQERNNFEHQFFINNKKDVIEQGTAEIKSIIIRLAKKYTRQLKENIFEYVEEE